MGLVCSPSIPRFRAPTVRHTARSLSQTEPQHSRTHSGGVAHLHRPAEFAPTSREFAPNSRVYFESLHLGKIVNATFHTHLGGVAHLHRTAEFPCGSSTPPTRCAQNSPELRITTGHTQYHTHRARSIQLLKLLHYVSHENPRAVSTHALKQGYPLSSSENRHQLLAICNAALHVKLLSLQQQCPSSLPPLTYLPTS